MAVSHAWSKSTRSIFLAIFLATTLTIFIESRNIRTKKVAIWAQRIKSKAYHQLRSGSKLTHRLIKNHDPGMHLIETSQLRKDSNSSEGSPFGQVFNMDPPELLRLRAKNAHRTLWVIPGYEGNCGWYGNYVCKFWHSIRCNMFGGFQNVQVASLEKVMSFSRAIDIIVLAYRPHRMHDHETPPPSLTNLTKWRDKNFPGLKIGVFHVANEQRRTNWTWYVDADFVLRNYWLPAGRFPPHVAYIPLHPQMPSICRPEFPSSSPKIACSCEGRQLPIASKRQYLYSFSGSLRRGRKAMIQSFQNSSLASKGYFHLAKTFGGNGKVLHLDSILNSTFVLAPCGNVMETHRIYEALALGAIPVIERCSDKHMGENLDDFFPYRDLIVKNIEGMVQFVSHYANNPKEKDALQLRVLTWWRAYSREVIYNITRITTTHIPRISRWNP